VGLTAVMIQPRFTEAPSCGDQFGVRIDEHAPTRKQVNAAFGDVGGRGDFSPVHADRPEDTEICLSGDRTNAADGVRRAIHGIVEQIDLSTLEEPIGYAAFAPWLDLDREGCFRHTIESAIVRAPAFNAVEYLSECRHEPGVSYRGGAIRKHT
jgi:hypothetical protein